MSISLSFANHFLIAMPNLADPNFYRSVTYICKHDEQGAMGIIINKPINSNLASLAQNLGITEPLPPLLASQPIFYGGPIELERGFVLHPPGGIWQAMFSPSPEITLTTSRDIIEALVKQQGPTKNLIALGYAGWSDGQLEQELLTNSWLTVPADPAIIFDTPIAERWHKAAALGGIDLNKLSSLSGHA